MRERKKLMPVKLAIAKTHQRNAACAVAPGSMDSARQGAGASNPRT